MRNIPDKASSIQISCRFQVAQQINHLGVVIEHLLQRPPWRRRARPEVCEIDGFVMIDRRVHRYSAGHLCPGGDKKGAGRPSF